MPRGVGEGSTALVYPSGCREVKEDLSPDELIRRLKTLAHTFQSMGQDEGAYHEFVPLALHLASEYFLLHPSKDVQLLIACCIADVLRVYAPEAPYKDPEQVKEIFMFLIKQLSGLKDPKDPAFKRYFYLLENLAYVKSFNMCFELDDCQEIFCNLFQLMFRIVNDEHSGKVKSFMLDVLCPLITESDSVSNNLLDTILINIVEPSKSTKKNAYLLAKELIVKCSDTLESYIQTFFNQVLILGQPNKELSISGKVYDLIYELNHICPTVLLAVLPQLEFKLKSPDEKERLGAVSLLARMFSEKDSTLAIHHRPLWQAFLGRYNDISVAIRTKCVQYSMHFLLNHPELRQDITQTLKLRQHDAEEHVRYEVVMAIVATAKRDFSVVSDSEDLLDFVRERTLDKKFKIRREAMSGLAMIYKAHLMEQDVPEATKKAVTWIKDKILHCYYMPGLDDKLMVEKLLNTCLVPFTLPTDERMKKLYYLLGTVDENATKAFIELQKLQLSIRKLVSEVLDLQNKNADDERDKELNAKIVQLSKHLPEPVKAHEFLRKFSAHMSKDSSLLQMMETVMNPSVSCKTCSDVMSQILKRLGQPVMTNLYYNTVKMLLERTSSVMVDHDAIKVLVGYVEQCIKHENLMEELHLNPQNAGERGLNLLKVLAFVFPSHFLHEDVIAHLISLLDLDDVAPLVLTILTLIGKFKPIGEAFPDLMRTLVPKCQQLCGTGGPKDAKHAIRCLFHNTIENMEGVFSKIMEQIRDNLDPSNPHYLTAIVALGHLAYNAPQTFPVIVKNTISRKIVKELLMKDRSDGRYHDCPDNWCKEEDLPHDTICKLKGLKTMALWLLGLKDDTVSAFKTFRMIDAFIVNKGDLLEENRLSVAEKSWLRLGAGCAMLKICEQKGVGDQFNATQFFNLSQLMQDEVPQVRERFATKLHQGLSRRIPLKCLPLDFMGYYALAGAEPDIKLRKAIQEYMVSDIQRRRDYIKAVTLSGSVERALNQLPHLMPDFMLVFAVPVLAHDPEFRAPDNKIQLQRVQKCLWFILEPLMMRNDNYCFGFYKSLIERMKNHFDAVNPTDDLTNHKLWAVCDIAMGLVMSKTTNYEMKKYPTMPRVPPMYFKRGDDPNYINHKVYVPLEFTVQHMKKNVTPTQAPPKSKRKNPNDSQDSNSIDVDEDSSQAAASTASDDEPVAKKPCLTSSASSTPTTSSTVKVMPVANRKYGQQKGDAKRGRARKSQSPSPSREDDEDGKSSQEIDEDEIPSSDEIERRATKSYNRKRKQQPPTEEESDKEEGEEKEAEKSETVEEPEEVKPVTKTRGRARKQPLTAVNTTKSPTPPLSDTEPEVTEPVKKRGRPRKDSTTPTSTPSTPSTSNSNDKDTKSSDEMDEPAEKRKRGRPKVVKEPEPEKVPEKPAPVAKTTRKSVSNGVAAKEEEKKEDKKTTGRKKEEPPASAAPVRHSTRQTRQASS
ncbi:sister chromatid cohesion protein PDS5 homolog A-A isoform X4 [Neocloeon triangulifer]|uniref:sister chromatid cohesion protein PDS5 homolog A-A isoform X4 n=1 Tax=Neocloeon triangulifer TaxID=2078957 RepID=UPI00286F2266|nr:sister chromatid cohesion protein PDS5 homolog A-A isoform X4 [Neocloeon triangulifer]